ncbi:MAG: hypothetical protein M3124_09840 [Actinomycetota bacterium]|nr:hypothetical protein [Actinomycetota bacterium]
MSGTIRNFLVDGSNMFLSARPRRDRYDVNRRVVVRVRGTVARLRPMPHEDARDGYGHGQLFKWVKCRRQINVRDSTFHVEKDSFNGRDAMKLPPGKFSNVTIVLGRRFDGDDDGNYRDRDYPSVVEASGRLAA